MNVQTQLRVLGGRTGEELVEQRAANPAITMLGLHRHRDLWNGDTVMIDEQRRCVVERPRCSDLRARTINGHHRDGFAAWKKVSDIVFVRIRQRPVLYHARVPGHLDEEGGVCIDCNPYVRHSGHPVIMTSQNTDGPSTTAIDSLRIMLDPSALAVCPMTEGDAAVVAAWRYTGDWSIYNLASDRGLVDQLACYHSVFLDGELIGFCCVGEAARVRGLPEDPAVVDIGMGMNPALVGQGHGKSFGQVVLSYVEDTHPDRILRAVVQMWNARSLRLTRSLGFEDAGELTAIQGGRPVTYRIVVKYSRLEGD